MDHKDRWTRKVLEKATIVLFAALVLLQALDLHSTWIGLGPRQETNALIVALGQWYGSIHIGLLLAKSFVFALIAFMFVAWRKAPHHSAARWVLAILLLLINTAMTLVVLSNYGV